MTSVTNDLDLLHYDVFVSIMVSLNFEVINGKIKYRIIIIYDLRQSDN